MIHKKLDRLLESVGRIPELLEEMRKTLRAVRGLRHRVDELEKRVHNLIIEGKECRLTGMGKPFTYPFPEDVPGPLLPVAPPGPPQSPTTVLYGVEPTGGGGRWQNGSSTFSNGDEVKIESNFKFGDVVEWVKDIKSR